MMKNGFTLIEILLTVSIAAILMLMSSSFYGQFTFSREVAVTRDQLMGSFAKARLYSILGKNDAAWGVALNNGKIILFAGNSFAARDSDFDETFDVEEGVGISGLSEVVFARTTGQPDNQPTVILSGHGTSEAYTLNREGVWE